MKEFVSRHAEKIIGSLSGFDRLLLRGTIRQLAHVAGLTGFLSYKSILLKDFTRYAEAITERIKSDTKQLAEAAGRPVRYLSSSRTSKEEAAREILKKNPVDSGLICVLTCVEPCMSYEVHRNRQRKILQPRAGIRKCLHLYYYFLDPELGLMHARLQSWFPFGIQICLNGREWLAHQMDRAGIAYRQRDNCFTWIEDLPAAQRLMDKQLRTNWPRRLDSIRQQIFPSHSTVFGDATVPYYWSVHQMEWATDIMFQDPQALAALYPHFTRYAISHFSSADVLRFLGRELHGNFKGEVTSDYRRRPEGLRVKHRVNQNSVKVYDKQGSVLRVETTINDPRDLKEYRRKEGDPKSTQQWRRLRKGVAAIHRVATVSQAANCRYLESLSHVHASIPVKQVVDRLCRPITRKHRRYRALRPWSQPDISLLTAINRGEFVIAGFRNRDLRAALFPKATGELERRRASARVSRLLGILRAHGLISKTSGSYRYQLTPKGRQAITAILAARDAEISSLLQAAA